MRASKRQFMLGSSRNPGFRFAAQQGKPIIERSLAWPAPSALARGALVALVSASLLGAAPAVREFDLSIVKRRVEGSASSIRVKRGETVLLRWRSDEAVSLHVHGYDLQVKVSPAAPASVRFEAGVAGRFGITAHEYGAAAEHGADRKKHRERTLLYLEVLPE